MPELSTSEVVAIAAVVGLALTVWQILLSAATERRRSQPIVVAHETLGRLPSGTAGIWAVRVRITSEGEGTAFNVRFGVSYYGARFAFRLEEDDPLSGNRHRVLHPREEIDASVRFGLIELIGGKGVPEDTAYYWARYQNSQGKTWETLNPPDRSADLNIRRVYLPKLREWWEGRRRRKLTKRGEEQEREIVGQLLSDEDYEP